MPKIMLTDDMKKECEETCSNILSVNNTFFPMRAVDLIEALSESSKRHLNAHESLDISEERTGKNRQQTCDCSQLISTLIEANQTQQD